jgi:hypothetical protein
LGNRRPHPDVRLSDFKTDSPKWLRATHTFQPEGFDRTKPKDQVATIKPLLPRVDDQFNRIKSIEFTVPFNVRPDTSVDGDPPIGHLESPHGPRQPHSKVEHQTDRQGCQQRQSTQSNRAEPSIKPIESPQQLA